MNVCNVCACVNGIKCCLLCVSLFVGAQLTLLLAIIVVCGNGVIVEATVIAILNVHTLVVFFASSFVTIGCVAPFTEFGFKVVDVIVNYYGHALPSLGIWIFHLN